MQRSRGVHLPSHIARHVYGGAGYLGNVAVGMGDNASRCAACADISGSHHI